MKISTLRRSVSGVAAVALVAAGVAITAAPASAANLGGLTLNPATGQALTVSSFVTPGQCATPGDTVKVNVFGGTDVAGGLIVASIPQATPKNIVGVNTAASFFTPSGGMSIGSPQTWSTFASTNGLGALNGTYTLTAVCGNGDTFQGTVNWVGNNVAGALYTSPVGTSTVLAPITSPVGFGVAIPVTATVTPTSSATVTGTVDFKDGATTVATATVGAGGVATGSISSLAVGTHSITAVYTPDAAAIAASISGSTSTPAQSVTVTAGVGTLAFSGVQPTTGSAGGSATFTVACGPTAVSGTLTVSFVGTSTTPIFSGPCTGAAVVTVPWTISAAQAQEAGNVTASFLPSNPNFSTPANVSTPFTVGAPTGVINNETIQVTVPVGALSATVVNNPTVVLGNWTLNSDGRYNTATGIINPVKIIDTRAGDFGWTLSARANDFVPCGSYSTTGLNYYNAEPTAVNDPNQPTIGGANPGLPGTGITLGGLYQNNATQGLIPGCISPSTLASAPRAYQKQAISANNLGILTFFNGTTTSAAQPGTLFTPNTGLVPFTVQPDLQLPGTAAGATKGVRAQRTLVDATGGLAGPDGQVIGSATGVVNVQGALTLNVPTVTVAGAYATTLTLTVVSK